MDDVSFARRFVALLIDWAVAVLSTAAITQTALAGPGAASGFLVLGIFFLEVAVLTGTLGFSIGKRVAGLVVEAPGGRPIGLPRALLRTALLCLVVPAIIQNDEQRGLHEIVSGSRVARRRSV